MTLPFKVSERWPLHLGASRLRPCTLSAQNTTTKPKVVSKAYTNIHCRLLLANSRHTGSLAGNVKVKKYPAVAASWDDPLLDRFPYVVQSLRLKSDLNQHNGSAGGLPSHKELQTEAQSSNQNSRWPSPVADNSLRGHPTPPVKVPRIETKHDQSSSSRKDDEISRSDSISTSGSLQKKKKMPKSSRGQRKTTILKEILSILQLQKKPSRPIQDAARLSFDYLPHLQEVARRNNGEKNQWNEVDTKSLHGTALVVVYKASKFLSKTDFDALTPRGRHIREWVTNGRISAIIRGRNKDTLERNGDYYLLFDTVSAAQAYIHRVHTIHNMSKGQTQDLMTTKTPSARDSSLGYSDPALLLKSYAIFPPGPFRMAIEIPPYGPTRRRIIENRGYEQLVRERISDHEVLITLNGYKTSLQQVTQSLALNGREMGMTWDFASASPLRHVLRDAWDDEQEHSDIELMDGEAESEATPAKQIISPANADREDSQFILSFETHQEAQRFITTWHGRDMSRLFDRSETGTAVIVNAELTW